MVRVTKNKKKFSLADGRCASENKRKVSDPNFVVVDKGPNNGKFLLKLELGG